MSNAVNAYFHMFYPDDWETTEPAYCGSYGRKYSGNGSTIFPEMVCADGLRMSVQGHFGAYSHPKDDFADEYRAVEIMAKPRADELLAPFERECNAVGDKMIYPYVPVDVVAKVIEKHGGLVAPTGRE